MASVSIKKSGNGTFTRSFYGKYTDRSGKSRVKIFSTPMEGKLPANGSMKSSVMRVNAVPNGRKY